MNVRFWHKVDIREEKVSTRSECSETSSTLKLLHGYPL